MLAQMAGLELNGAAHNEPAAQIQDVSTARVTMSSLSGVVALPRLRENAWRAIGVSSPARMQAAPDLPTVAEPGFPGFKVVAWPGVVAPASMPAANVARVNRDVVAALAEPEMRTRLTGLDVELVRSTPEKFRVLIKRKIPRMAGVLSRAGIRPE